MVDWLLGESGAVLSGVLYFLAACTATWGASSAVMKSIGDNHSTVRDVTTVLGLAAAGVTLLVALGAFVPSILGGA